MSVVPPSSLLSGQLVDGRYRIGDVIGQGAMSEVYSAEDERLGRTVAFKVLRGSATDRGRFEEETALLCTLDHPNLVRLHDAGEHDGIPYLVLNILDRTLADELRARPLAPAAAAQMASEIASALAYLHDRGIVHRDVKPSNILLRPDGSACLADLGAALSLDGPRLTATGLTIGTPMYLAPEQATGSEVTSAADVYSLGLVTLEAVSGRAAFEGSQQESIASRLTRPPEVPEEVPAPLRAALVPAVALEPEARPSAAEATTTFARVAVALEQTGGDLDTTAEIVPTTATMPVVLGVDADPTETLAPAVAGSATPSATPIVDRVTEWVAANRDQAILIGVGVVVLLVVLFGIATADGTESPAVVDDPVTTTVATTVPPTTAPVAVVPPVEQPCEEGCGNGRREEKKDKGRDDDD